MLSFQVFGADTHAAEAVGILTGLALLLGTHVLGCRLIDRRHGLPAALVRCTTYPFLRNARSLRIDALPALLVLLGLRCVLEGRRRRSLLAGFWACTALAVGVKGPAGLLGVPVLLL
jgi:4-amino-4-deoxy-L-arabinose transferase-like glycosyltransferase